MPRHLELVGAQEPRASLQQKPENDPSWTSAGLMAIALLTFIYEALAYNLIYLGRVLPAVGKDIMVVPYAVTFNLAWCLGMWSYMQAHLSDPGTVPVQWHHFVRGSGQMLHVAPARAEWQPALATLCRKCLLPRPERAHHCLICGICVLRMDHHCPWINNCVGFYNHKYFLLLGIYADIACFIALISTFPELIRCMLALTDSEAGFAWMPDALKLSDIVVFLIFGTLTSMICVLLTQMLMVHTALAAKNSTSIEDQYRNMSNPFDQGSILANIAQIVGAYGLDWFFPVRPRRPLSDGVAFPCADEERWGLTSRQHEGGLVADHSEDSVHLWRMRYNVHPPHIVPHDPGPEWTSQQLLPQFFGCVNPHRWRPHKCLLQDGVA